MQCYFEKKYQRYNFLFKNKQKQAKMDFELKKLIFEQTNCDSFTPQKYAMQQK